MMDLLKRNILSVLEEDETEERMKTINELLAQKQKELVSMAQAKKDYRRWRMRWMTFGNRGSRSWLKRPGLKAGKNG
ncbi:MAG: hypothetical protein PUE50_00695 [Firmicutes bacterium]|nr:hypothetical protein [Bacillota bacterium]